MTRRTPAKVGSPLSEVDTPALIVDLDALERNLEVMAKAVEGTGARLRPHAKSHKCPEIGRRQMALGAVGVCCQKVSEAEAMVAGGINNVLVSNQVVGKPKLDRLAELGREAWVGVCVDDAGNVDDLNVAAARAGTKLTVLVEIDVGAGRCGVSPGEAAVALAKHVRASEQLRFGGLQAYQGRAQHIRDFGERRRAVEAAAILTRQTVHALAAEGLSCDIVGGAGTGTYAFETATGIYNELQVGSYVFMDADYGRNLGADGGPIDDFEQSLYVYTTVMSRPAGERAYVDAGLKAFSVDCGMPTVLDLDGATLERASDEHGALILSRPDGGPKLGDKIRLIPGHCDPTVNLYDWLVGIRGDRVECLWEISARGAVL